MKKSLRVVVVAAALALLMALGSGTGFAKVTIDFWTLFTGPDGRVMGELVERFNAEHPDIEVVMQILPWGEPYYSRLATSVVSGEAPQVAICHDYMIPRFASTNAVYPINESMLEVLEMGEEMFYEAVWNNSGSYEGVRYGIPLDFHGFGVYYNVDLLHEAGMSSEFDALPVTGDEFVAALKKMTKDLDGDGTIDRWGIIAPLDWFRAWSLWAGVWQYGGDFLSEDKTRSTWNTEIGRKSLQFQVDLIHKHQVMSPELSVNPFLAFYQGQAATMISGVWEVLGAEAAEGLNYTVGNHPLIGPEKVYAIGSHTFVLPVQARRDAEKERAALTFIKWILDHNIDWVKAGQCPSRLDVLEIEEFKTAPYLLPQRTIAQQGAYGRYLPKLVPWSRIQERIVSGIEAALLGHKTVEQALADMDREIDAILARGR